MPLNASRNFPFKTQTWGVVAATAKPLLDAFVLFQRWPNCISRAIAVAVLSMKHAEMVENQPTPIASTMGSAAALPAAAKRNRAT